MPMRSFRAAFALGLVTLGVQGAAAEPITTCTQGGSCYCINADFLAVIQERVSTIRARLAAERAAGKATGYISIPISTLEGSYFKVNGDVSDDEDTCRDEVR